jgi:glycosyltransferase involved in cell wall biosynthesis
MNLLVSVVIATYNYARYLAGALDSALGQTVGAIEVIVIDDGSTDNTAAVVAPYRCNPRVRYVVTEHRGQPAAKNAGIRLARAPWIAFLDADDLWLPAKLEHQLKLVQTDWPPGVVYARRLLIDAEGRALEYRQPPLHRGYVLSQMFRDNFVCFSSAVVARRVFDEVGLFDESLSLAIDYDLWLRAAARWRFDFVDEPLVKYRVGHASLSRRTEERLATAERIMRRFLDEHGGRSLLDPRLVHRAWAETCRHRALAARSRSRWAALGQLARSLSYEPFSASTWKDLASLPLAESWRRWLRRRLGKADWTARPRHAPAGAPQELSTI